MAEYNNGIIFGTLVFVPSDIIKSTQPSTIKHKLGSQLIEKRIPLNNNKDIVLTIRGVLEGRTATQGQDKTTVIQTERDTLEALNDGDKHDWTDGKHNNKSMAIRTGSLVFDDKASREPGGKIEFSMVVVQW